MLMSIITQSAPEQVIRVRVIAREGAKRVGRLYSHAAAEGFRAFGGIINFQFIFASGLSKKDRQAASQTQASGGLSPTGKMISGLEHFDRTDDVMVFHAGTKRTNDTFMTAGGRVLGVTAFGSDIKNAIENSYTAVNKIKFENAYFRSDIGYRAVG